MKKRILFICEELYSIDNANTSCAYNIINELAQYYEVTVYVRSLINECIFENDSCKYDIKSPPSNRFDRIMLWLNHLRVKSINRLAIRKADSLIINIFKAITYFIVILSKFIGYSTYSAWSHNLPRYINKNDDITKYHCIIAIAAPFSNVKAAIKIKRTHDYLKLLIIEFDLYSDNATRLTLSNNNKFDRGRRIKEEKMWYKYADKIVVMNEMFDTIVRSELNIWRSKIVSYSTPVLLVNSDSPDKATSIRSNDINVVYTGRFYEDIRNPRYTLELFKNIVLLDPRIILHIYSSGCEDIISEYALMLKNNIVVHGIKKKHLILEATEAADFLLNISNSIISQAPSKIVEYISTGKPIINIYSIEGDLCENILKEYSLSLSVCENYEGISETTNKVLNFIRLYRGKRLSSFDIIKHYEEFTPSSFVRKLSAEIDNILM